MRPSDVHLQTTRRRLRYAWYVWNGLLVLIFFDGIFNLLREVFLVGSLWMLAFSFGLVYSIFIKHALAKEE